MKANNRYLESEENITEMQAAIQKLMSQNYRSFVKALCRLENIDITDEEYEDWLTSDYSLINDTLQD